MSFAYQDIETHPVIAVPAGAVSRHVIILTKDRGFGTSMLAAFAADAAIAGHVVTGNLSALSKSLARDTLLADVLVFETGDLGSDCAALTEICGRSDGSLTCVGLTRSPLPEVAEQALLAAGATEVVVVDSIQSEIAPPLDVLTGSQPARSPLVLAEAARVFPDPSPITAIESKSHFGPPAFDAIPHFLERVAAPLDKASTPTSAVPPLPQDSLGDYPAPASHLPRSSHANGGRVTVVMRARGGAGASTLAVNLAAGLAQTLGPGKVAILDLDIQNGTVATLLDLPDSAAFTDLIRHCRMPDAAFLDSAIAHHDIGLHVLPAPDVFAPMTALTPTMLTTLIPLLQDRYDHVIVDLPAVILDWAEPVLSSASRALIVTDTSVPSIKRARRLIDVVTEDHMTLPVEIVVNREKKPMLLSAAQREAARVLNRPLQHWIPSDPTVLRKSQDMGVPLCVDARRSAVAKAIDSVTKAILRPERRS